MAAYPWGHVYDAGDDCLSADVYGVFVRAVNERLRAVGCQALDESQGGVAGLHLTAYRTPTLATSTNPAQLVQPRRSIYPYSRGRWKFADGDSAVARFQLLGSGKIGRASCRERVSLSV